MNLSRRGFLKGLGAIAAAAYAPSLIKGAASDPAVAEVVKPLPPEAAKHIRAAWVNFDGAAQAPKIRDSLNVASVDKTGPGEYMIHFDGMFKGKEDDQ